MPTVPNKRRNADREDGERVIRRRNRRPISCKACRIRKLRCDRKLPACSSCLSRPDIDVCEYHTVTNSAIPNDQPSTGEYNIEGRSTRNPRGNQRKDGSSAIYDKLERLEGMIYSYMEDGDGNADGDHVGDDSDSTVTDSHSHTGGDNNTEMERIVDEVSRLPPSQNFVSRAGETLWSTLMSELAEVRAHVDQSVNDPASSLPTDGAPTLLFGAGQRVTREEILLHLPSRYSCNKMIKKYFDTLDPALCFVHRPDFRSQYEEFWEDRDKKSITWVALLYGFLRIAVQGWIRDGGEPQELRGKCPDLAESYRRRVAECLIHVDYTRPQEPLIEALLLHMYAEYASTRDFNPSVWVLHGTVVRMAMRMGYHFHPRSRRDVSPFQAEMRSRSWAYIQQAEILFSFQAGLPSTLPIRFLEGDLPRNINDIHFKRESPELPPSAPASEMTDASYLIAKAKLATGFANVLRELDQGGEIPYQLVLNLDAHMRSIYNEVPPDCQVHSLPELPVEDPWLLIMNLILANIFNKALCVIHARYLNLAHLDEQFLYSRTTCLKSALALLSFQRLQHRRVIVDQLPTSLTRYQTSITTHDFFFAATMLCTGLLAYNGEIRPGLSDEPPREEMLEALDHSVGIFRQLGSQSAEARRANTLLSSLLQSIRSQPSQASSGPRRSARHSSGVLEAENIDPNLRPARTEGSSPLAEDFDMTELWGGRNAPIYGRYLTTPLSVNWSL